MEKQSIVFAKQLKLRTKTFALRTIKLFQSLPKTDEAKIIGKQLIRSATSVGATVERLVGQGQKMNTIQNNYCS